MSFVSIKFPHFEAIINLYRVLPSMNTMSDQPRNSVPFEFDLSLPPSTSAVSLLSNPMSSTGDFSCLSMDVSAVTLDAALLEEQEDYVEEKRRRKENRQKHGRTCAKHGRQAPSNFRWQSCVSKDTRPSPGAGFLSSKTVGLAAPCLQRPNISRTVGNPQMGLSVPLRKRSNPNFMRHGSTERSPKSHAMGLSIPMRKRSNPGLMDMVLEEAIENTMGGSINTNRFSLGSVSCARRSPAPNPATVALESSPIHSPKQQSQDGPNKKPHRRVSNFCVNEFLQQPMAFPELKDASTPGRQDSNHFVALPPTRFARQESTASSSAMPNMPARKESLMSFMSTSSSSNKLP